MPRRDAEEILGEMTAYESVCAEMGEGEDCDVDDVDCGVVWVEGW